MSSKVFFVVVNKSKFVGRCHPFMSHDLVRQEKETRIQLPFMMEPKLMFHVKYPRHFRIWSHIIYHMHLFYEFGYIQYLLQKYSFHFCTYVGHLTDISFEKLLNEIHTEMIFFFFLISHFSQLGNLSITHFFSLFSTK